MAYSSKGNKVAYVVDFYPASAHQDSIFVEDLDSGVIKNITKGAAKFYWVVSWSPDDSYILLCGSKGDVDKWGRSVNHILILNSDGSNIRDVTPFENAYIDPTSWRKR
jgi:Tol biopolymer transport system component